MLLAQTNWLRMPARELGASLEPPNGAQAVGTTLLRRHKILPHPQEERTISFNPSTPAAKRRDLVIDTGLSSVTSSDSSSPRTLKHASRRIGALPPTPPTHSRQSSGSHSRVTAPNYDASASDEPSAPSTPPNQTPPTPDFTPPRVIPTALRHPPSDRYSPSRNDSFQTARENPCSSDEDDFSTVRPGLPSMQSKDTVPRIPKNRKEVGLGLGLESDNEGTTTPRGNADQQEFVVFDGEWGSAEEASEVEREWDDNLMRNVTVRKRPGRKLHMFDGADGVLEDDIISPTIATRVVRSLPLQERIARHRLERDAADRISTEKFAERMAWPPSVADPESPSVESPTTPDVRRFSEMSARSNSTVVEVMVIDAPPLRRKTLRHTKKYVGLRNFSDQSTSSASVVSDLQHRLVHKTSKIPDRRHRSLASNTTVSTSSSKSRREALKSGAIPVVVIPDRRSSSKSKTPSLRSTSSRRTKRSMSLGSAPLSQSSKYNGPGYLPRKRTQSDSDSVRTIDYPPIIPARRSSLSAPTSQNTSRAPSLTAESLKAHNMMERNRETKPVVHNPLDLKDEVPSGHLSVGHNPLTRPSTQHTPFSQVSYETAGTAAEVSEAMAVTLFPHQNKSVLVVQQKAPESSPPLPEINTSMVHGKATGRVAPPQPNHPMDEVDSPLRNPRAPPEPPGPPVIKFIPPTPAGLDASQEADQQLGYEPAEEPKRAISLRRAFTRRNSEPVRPGKGFLQRTFSLGRPVSRDETSKDANPAIYPTVADQPADGSKLHPFWCPTHFWDDLDEASNADDELRYPAIDNRPALPKRSLSGKLKRTFAILPIKDEDTHPVDRRTMRRTPSGNMRVVKRRSNSSLQRDAERYVPGTDDFGYGYAAKEDNGGRIHTIPGLGVRFEYVGWTGMKRRLSERRRERLRGSISAPRGVRSGVDDVLRGRSQV